MTWYCRCTRPFMKRTALASNIVYVKLHQTASLPSSSWRDQFNQALFRFVVFYERYLVIIGQSMYCPLLSPILFSLLIFLSCRNYNLLVLPTASTQKSETGVSSVHLNFTYLDQIYYIGSPCLAILTPKSCMIQCVKTQSLNAADWHNGF